MDPIQITQILSELGTKEGECRILKAKLLEAAISELRAKHQQEIRAMEAKIEAEAAALKAQKESDTVERRTQEMETLTSLWRTGAEDSEMSVERENQLADLLGVPRRKIVWEGPSIIEPHA